MPARNRKDAAKQGKIRGFQEGDIIGVKKAGRGNTGPEWLQGTILSVAPGGFYDYEVEYVNPPAGNKFRRVCEFHCVPWSAVECDSATDYGETPKPGPKPLLRLSNHLLRSTC